VGVKAHAECVECKPIMGSGAEPPVGSRAEPLVRGPGGKPPP